MKAKLAVAAFALALIPAVALAGQAERKDFQVLLDVAKSVNRYAQLSVFDDISASVDQGVVTLVGKVTMPYKRDDIAKRVAKIDGVKSVRNQIQVLPVSQFDDELRFKIARAIYGSPSFWNYATMVNPPIHIVVDRGRVTLTGVVNSDVERALARTLAVGWGEFSVDSQLKTDAEAAASLEKAKTE